MYIIAGSTGTLGTAIVDALSKDNELFLIGRDETKLKEQASAINADYQVIDLNNTVEPREFSKIIDSETEMRRKMIEGHQHHRSRYWHFLNLLSS